MRKQHSVGKAKRLVSVVHPFTFLQLNALGMQSLREPFLVHVKVGLATRDGVVEEGLSAFHVYLGWLRSY